MRIRYVSGTLGMFFTLFSNAQVVSDTIKSVDLSEVVGLDLTDMLRRKRLP